MSHLLLHQSNHLKFWRCPECWCYNRTGTFFCSCFEFPLTENCLVHLSSMGYCIGLTLEERLQWKNNASQTSFILVTTCWKSNIFNESNNLSWCLTCFKSLHSRSYFLVLKMVTSLTQTNRCRAEVFKQFLMAVAISTNVQIFHWKARS